MNSKKKIRANQENAKGSTGPKTQKGKKAASQNSLKHGIWARQLTISKDERADYEKLVSGLSEVLKPQGLILQFYFDEIILCMWRLRMLVPIESRQLLPPATEKDESTSVGSSDDLASTRHQDAKHLEIELSLLRQLREATINEDFRWSELKQQLLYYCGQDFVDLVHKLFPHHKSFLRNQAQAAAVKGTEYGITDLLAFSEDVREMFDGENTGRRRRAEESTSLNAPFKELDEGKRLELRRTFSDEDLNKRLLLDVINRRIELMTVLLSQRESRRPADNVLLKFDLQLRYRASLTRDLRRAIDAFLYYRSLLHGPQDSASSAETKIQNEAK